jgi:hypothetical protein
MRRFQTARKVTKYIRCGTPDCDWGTPFVDLSENRLDRCRNEFRSITSSGMVSIRAKLRFASALI